MILHSKFRDYYDYLIGIYGKDDKIVYDRETLNETIFVHNTQFMRMEAVRKYRRNLRRIDIEEEFLFVNGKCYPRVSEYQDDGTYTKMDFCDFSSLTSQDIQSFYRFRDPKSFIFIDHHGMEHPYFIMLSRLVGNPIFIIKRHYVSSSSKKDYVEFLVEPVNLSEIGFQKFIPPHELYVELQYFLVNVLKPVPDSMPEGKPPLTDNERLLAKGFDKKISFRHRK